MSPERLITRAWQCVLVVLAAATLAFILLHLTPGDPAAALGEGVPAAVKARMRTLYGLDQPLARQYIDWITALLRGDLGWSIQQQRPVTTVLGEALLNSLLLGVPAFIVSVVLGIAIGTWQALHAGSRGDRSVSSILLLAYSLPEFWLALLLMLIFARTWHLLPASGATDELHSYMSLAGRLTDRLRHLILPLSTVSLIGVATFARFQRESMREIWQQPFVRTGIAAGLTRRRLVRSAVRSAVLPVITLAGVLLPSYFAGLIFVETVFSWPGLGYVLMRAISARDYAVVAASVVLGSALTAVGAWAAEWLRGLLDPRLRSLSSQGQA